MLKKKQSKNEWIGDIPIKWNEKPIRYVFNEIKEKNKLGLVTKALKFTYGTIISKTDFDADEDNYVANTILTYNIVSPGTIMINCLNLNYDFVSQRIGLVKDNGVITSAYLPIKPINDNVIDSEYANYQLKAWDNVKAFHNMGSGVRKTLDFNELGKKYILLPPIEMQKRIVSYLNLKCAEIDALHIDIERQIETLEEYKKSIITEAVTKGLDPDVEMEDSGIEWIGEINSNFSMGKLGLFSFVTKLAGFEYTDVMCKSINNEGNIPIVRAQNVRMLKNNFESIKEFIDYETSIKLSRCALDKKCLLMTFIGAGIGDVCVFDKRERYHLAPNVAKIEIVDKNKLIDEFVMYYICSYAGIGEINKISKASAQPSLSMETIRGIKIVIPTLKEQTEIVQYLNEKCIAIDDIITNKREQLETLDQYKKSLIYEYVTGKKEVPED